MAQIMNDNKSDPFPQLGTVYRKGSGNGHVEQLSEKNAANISITSGQNGKIAAKGWGPQSSTPNVWGCPNVMHKLGVRCNGNAKKSHLAESKNLSSCGNEVSSRQDEYINQEWNATALQVGSVQLNIQEQKTEKDDYLLSYPAGITNDKKSITEKNDDHDDDENLFGSSDDEDLLDDHSDVDTSEKSDQTCNRRTLFKSFFDDMVKLNIKELNSPGRKWHCPACKGGPGAIDWYRGLEPLMYHALTTKTRRVKLHRAFAEFLDEEAQKWRISVAPVGVACGRWKGLNDEVKDYEIVWPPMVVITNTRYEQEENGKWTGMGNQELLDHFKSYAALKARHSYGPQGHRGMSVLIFDDSAAGYLEAARLHKHFKEQGRDREAWKRNRYPLCSGGKRQLYGYVASKEDLDFFNQHSQGRSKLKFEMRSYQEMVERQIRQINENNQQLVKCKDKIAKEQKQSQILVESVIRLTGELRRTTEANSNTRRQTKFLLEENKEEMNCQVQFFMDQIKLFRQAIDAKEDKSEKLQQANANISAVKDTHRLEDIASAISLREREMDDEFETERKKLIKSHEDKKASIVKRCWEELLHLEKEFENELTQLMKKYNTDHPEDEKLSNC